MTLSIKQMQFVNACIAGKSKIYIAHGAVRGGKSHAATMGFVQLVDRCPNNEIIMIGNSFSTIVENVVKPIKDIFYRGYCNWEPGNQKLNIGTKEIRVIGANDERAVRAIQGNTHSLAYVDEMTTIPTSFLDMLTTRLSHDWSKLVATCNPSSPMHPIKTQLIDSEDEEYCYALHFDIDDNPVLSDRTKSDLKTKYSGLFYKRYILGQWVMAEGSIFADFDAKTHVIPRAAGCANKYYCGVDYGANNPFAAVLIGFRKEHSPRFWVEKELYWDPAKTFRFKTNSEYAEDLRRFIDGYNCGAVYIDPSALSFKIELKRYGIRVIDADNDVFPGVTFVSNLFSNHQLKVVKDCPNLIKEIEMYVWDAKKALRGIEEPVKQNDHCCDAMRYALYTAFGNKLKLDDGYQPPEDKGARIDPRELGFRRF